MSEEREHAITLGRRLIEFASTLNVDPRIRDAIALSLESGTLLQEIEMHLLAARQREREAHEHPTPVVHVSTSPIAPSDVGGEKGTSAPTLPTEPPPGVSFDDPPERPRSITQTYQRRQ